MGHSANVNVLVPYARGDFEGTLTNSSIQAYRSGLGDAQVRFAMNLSGGPAMSLGDYLKWTEKRLLGASLTVTIPTGQYDTARVVNIGSNRWGVEAGNWFLETLAPLGGGRIRRRLVFYRQ